MWIRRPRSTTGDCFLLLQLPIFSTLLFQVLTLPFAIPKRGVLSIVCILLTPCPSLVWRRRICTTFFEFGYSLRWTPKGIWVYFDTHGPRDTDLLEDLLTAGGTSAAKAVGAIRWKIDIQTGSSFSVRTLFWPLEVLLSWMDTLYRRSLLSSKVIRREFMFDLQHK